MNQRLLKKQEHLKAMQKSIDTIKEQSYKDIHHRDEKTALSALAVQLIIATSERVGNHESAKNGHYGIVTLEKAHVQILPSDHKVKLQYVGKSGVEHTKTVKLRPNTHMKLKQQLIRNRKCLFQMSNGTKLNHKDINEYLSPYKVTSKDIRAFNANTLMKNLLPKGIRRDSRKDYFNRTLEKVAAQIGHTPSVLKRHYLMPDIEEKYLNR